MNGRPWKELPFARPALRPAVSFDTLRTNGWIEGLRTNG